MNWQTETNEKRKTNFHSNSILFLSSFTPSPHFFFFSLTLNIRKLCSSKHSHSRIILSYIYFQIILSLIFFSFNLHLNFCFSHFSIPSIHNAHSCNTLHHRHLRSKIPILYLRSFPPVIDRNNRIHFWIITAFVRVSKTVHLLMQKTVKLLANKFPSLTKSSHFSKFNLSKFVV